MKSKLKPEQLWALALAGILTEIRGGTHTKLHSRKMNLTSIVQKIFLKSTLKNWWGITNRFNLLTTLNETVEWGMHDELLSSVKEKIKENNFKINEYHEQYGLRYDFVLKNWDIYKDINIKAWDLGRMVSICQWGYDVGFLEETEAWELIMYFANLIQPLYNSWEEYGNSYALGRIFWASGFGEEDEYKSDTLSVLDKLFNKSSGHWAKLPWDIQLPEISKVAIGDKIMEFSTKYFGKINIIEIDGQGITFAEYDNQKLRFFFHPFYLNGDNVNVCLEMIDKYVEMDTIAKKAILDNFFKDETVKNYFESHFDGLQEDILIEIFGTNSFEEIDSKKVVEKLNYPNLLFDIENNEINVTVGYMVSQEYSEGILFVGLDENLNVINFYHEG